MNDNGVCLGNYVLPSSWFEIIAISNDSGDDVRIASNSDSLAGHKAQTNEHELHRRDIEYSICAENIGVIMCVVQSLLWIVYQLFMATILRFAWYWIVHQTFHRMHEWSITAPFVLVSPTSSDAIMTPTQQTIQKILHYWRGAHSIHHGYVRCHPKKPL